MASDAWIQILRRYSDGGTQEARQSGNSGGVGACNSWKVVPASLLQGISAALQGAGGTEMLSLPEVVAAHVSLWHDFADEDAIEATTLPMADKASIRELRATVRMGVVTAGTHLDGHPSGPGKTAGDGARRPPDWGCRRAW